MSSASGLRGISQFVILGCGWMLVIIMLEPCVVGVVGLDAAGSRIRTADMEGLAVKWAGGRAARWALRCG
jgi:hypothetical protein